MSWTYKFSIVNKINGEYYYIGPLDGYFESLDFDENYIYTSNKLWDKGTFELYSKVDPPDGYYFLMDKNNLYAIGNGGSLYVHKKPQ